MVHRIVCVMIVAGLYGCASSAPSSSAPPASTAQRGKAPAEKPTLGVLVVEGETTLRLTPAEFAALPHEQVAVEGKKGKEEFEGVALHAILARAGVPVGRHRPGHHPIEYVIAEAADGYRALFSLAEVDPALGGSAIYVVDRRGGQPLAEAEGPWRMVVVRDSVRSRWVRQLVALRLVTAP